MVVVEVMKWVDVVAMVALVEESDVVAMVERGFGNYARYTGIAC